jgi:KDO2-lipid IV(A) lauroyltransferase
MTGTERIAVKNRQAIFFLESSQRKRGYYEAEFRLITRNPETLKEYEATDIYHQMLEASIRRQPELWLWSHNRWKRTREEFNERFEVVGGKVVPREGKE